MKLTMLAATLLAAMLFGGQASAKPLEPGCYEGYTILHSATPSEKDFSGPKVAAKGIPGKYRKDFLAVLKQQTEMGVADDGTTIGYYATQEASAQWHVSPDGVLTSTGKRMVEGYVAVHDTSSFVPGMQLTVPSVYGSDRILTVEDFATGAPDKSITVWQQGGKASGKETGVKICVLKNLASD